MKLKKTIFYLFIIISIFFIYKFTFNNNVNYVALGDGLAKGINSYGHVSYGYFDYIYDYYNNLNRIGIGINDFANENYKVRDIYNDINSNKSIKTNIGYVNIKSALRESNLVTLSIGYNDFTDSININSNDYVSAKRSTDQILIDLEELLKLIKKYAKNKIIVIGIYNPYISNEKNSDFIDYTLKYFNSQYKFICEKNNIYYVDIFSTISSNSKYLSNPLKPYPNILGYREIFENIKKYL